MNKNEENFPNMTSNNRNIIVPDIYLEEFLNSITENRIKNLYHKLKLYESKGYVIHDKFIQSMKEIFDEPMKEKIKKKYEDIDYDNNPTLDQNINIEEYIDEIYELYFLRFREIKCIIKNNKTVFYLTDFKPENYISSYNIICSLTIFFKSCFENKIKLLFNLTDIDEDGFLNENEIKNMITTCNFLFCEELNIINTNSSILSQSLMNLKISNILKELLYDPGNLVIPLEEEKYINFDIFFKSIKLIKDYKYKIIPCYVSLKQCLNNAKKEKIIQINDKHKYDFIKISSSLFSNKPNENNKTLKFHKNSSAPYLSTILKPRKIINNSEFNNTLELPYISNNFFLKRTSVTRHTRKTTNSKIFKNKISEDNKNNSNNSLLSNKNEVNRQRNKNKLVIEKNKSFRELLRETTIIEMEDEKNKNEIINKNFNKNSYYNHDNREVKYIFEANFDKIRNIEVEPGLIKFINGNNEFSMSNNNQSVNIFKIKPHTENMDKKKHNEKTVNFNLNKEINSSIVQEEKSNDDPENRSKTSNNEAKNMKKIKIINFNDNNTNINSKTINQNTINTKGKLTKTTYLENLGKLVLRFQNSRHTSLRKKLNYKNTVNIQRNIMNLTNNEGKRYKTLDEVFHEIKVQENKFNSDSYGGYVASLLNGMKKIKEEQKDIKKLLGESDKKDLSLAFHKTNLYKLNKRNKPQVFRSKSVN